MAPLVAAALTAVLLALMLARGRRALPLDHPNERSLHDAPVPRSGGVALFAGAIAAWLLLPGTLPPALWAGLALLLAVSYIDDLHHLAVGWRLAAHLLAAGVLVYAELPREHGVLLAVCALLAAAWMTNLYNFMDGSDGLAGGMTAFGFGGYALAAWLGGHTSLALQSACIAGAALAFLAFNFHPARVFLGDAGSIPLGYLAAAFGLIGWRDGLWPAWFPLALFSPFVVDASVTLARRALRRERVWQAHRSHYYQRLVQSGFGHRNTALAEYALMAACAALAFAGLSQPGMVQAAIVVLLAALYLALIVLLERAWAKRGAVGES